MYRAVKRDGLWFLQKRTFYIFWNDVYVRSILMCAKSYLFFVPTLEEALNFGIGSVEIVHKDKDLVLFKEKT